MNVPIIVGVLVFIIILSIIFKVLKGAIRIVLSVLSVLFIVFVVLSIVVYMDARSMNDLMREGNKTMLYVEGDEVLAGVTITSGSLVVEGEGSLPENIVALDQESLDVYGLMLSGDLEPNDELVIIVTNGTFENESSFSLNDVNVSVEAFGEVMRSDDPRGAIIDEVLEGQDLPADADEEVVSAIEEQVADELEVFDDDELKAALFLMAFSQTVDEGNVSFIVDSIRDEDIVIAPDFYTLKLIKILPDGLLERGLEETMVVPRRDE